MAIPLEFPEFRSWRRNLTNLCDNFHSASPPYDPLDFRFNKTPLTHAPSPVLSSISESEALIAEYEEISSQLQLLQSNVQKQIHSVQQWADNRKSLISPIRRLSPDLIDLIMEHAATPSIEEHLAYDPAINFSQVCSTWRSQALNHPVLWSKFVIYLIPVPLDEDKVLKRIDVFVSRSYPLPLHIIILDINMTSLVEDICLDDMDLIDIVSPIRESILRVEVSDRLRYLDMTSAFLYTDIFPEINFPLLQTLTLSHRQLTGASFLSRSADNLASILLGSPQLRNLNLDLSFICQEGKARNSIPCDNLEWLKVSPHCFVYKVQFLSLSNLRTLYLVGSVAAGIPKTFPTLLNLPSLNVLYIEALEFLRRLETPQLTGFIMLEDTRTRACGVPRNTMNMNHTIQKFLLSSGCSNRLTHLTLILFPSDIPDVINLLELVSELEFLDLNGRVADAMLDADVTGLEDSELDHIISKNCIADYLYAFAELFNVMTYIFPDPNLDIASPPITILPNLKYLTFKSPNLLPPQFLTMVQSRSATHPPHAKLLRLELWVAREPTKIALSPEEVVSLKDDWDGIRDTLLELMRDGKMDVHTYSSDSAWL